MKHRLAALVLAAVAWPAVAQPAHWSPPPESERCPSRWGADDERGNRNLMTPAAIADAARLIRTGEMIELAHVLDGGMPHRHFHVTYARTTAPAGSNGRRGNEEFVAAPLGHVGTQMDGFSHQTIGDSLYNCINNSGNMSPDRGAARLGIQDVGTLFLRGVLIDVAALKNVARLPAGYVITPEDLQAALARENVALRPGDAVLINTGQGTLFGTDNALYMKGWAGLGAAAAEWLAGQQPVLVGADTTPVDVSPEPDPEVSGPAHQIFLVVNGIHIIEHMKLDELAAKQVYEFAFVVQPLKIAGGSGSTVSPVAIR